MHNLLLSSRYRPNRFWKPVRSLLYLTLLAACSTTGAESRQQEEVARRSYTEDVSWVDTTRVIQDDFHQEILSNGKLQPTQQAELNFKLDETITAINIKNGQRVKTGQHLATLENFNQQLSLEQAQQKLASAKTDMQDALIGYGYSGKDSADIPEQIYQAAQNKSGLLQARSELKKAEYDLRHTILRAPFSGVIANLEAKAHNAASSYKAFCVLIGDQRFEVKFQILETERELVQKGAQVEIEPFSMPGKNYKGNVSAINPLVDENGMIQLTATVNNNDRKLISGMNVKVRISKIIPDQLIVPKTALVLRQGRPVIFTWQNDTALWNYVEPGLENTEQISVQSGIKAEDIVITTGNLNLAHKSKVAISQ